MLIPFIHRTGSSLNHLLRNSHLVLLSLAERLDDFVAEAFHVLDGFRYVWHREANVAESDAGGVARVVVPGGVGEAGVGGDVVEFEQALRGSKAGNSCMNMSVLLLRGRFMCFGKLRSEAWELGSSESSARTNVTWSEIVNRPRPHVEDEDDMQPEAVVVKPQALFRVLDTQHQVVQPILCRCWGRWPRRWYDVLPCWIWAWWFIWVLRRHVGRIVFWVRV